MRLKNLSSIRLKIMALIVSALVLSLAFFLYIGTSLIRQDKLSYIYDYNLDRVRTSADLIDSKLEQDFSIARTLGRMVGPTPITLEEKKALEGAYETARSGVPGLILLRPLNGHKFTLIVAFGEKASEVELALAKSGWTPATLKAQEHMVGATTSGELSLAGRAFDSAGQPIAYAMLATLNEKLLTTETKGLAIHLVDSQGKTLLGKTKDSNGVESLDRELSQSRFTSGAREALVGGKTCLVAYQKLGSNQLTLVGLVPKDAAFAAVRTMIARSLLAGLGIALLASGVTLLFVRSLTSRIRELWQATLKVSQGDFTARVDTSVRTEDEVSGLARSFNTMADKIDDLITQTAQKARMAKELETAQVVQKLFFPATDFQHPSLRLAGQFVPASECSGDWWHYAAFEQHLVMVVGDATGHGVSAALVTAAAHAAFNLWVVEQRRPGAPAPTVEGLLKSLNTAVRAAAQGKVLMTCSACRIDLSTGEMVAVSAAHPAPILYRDENAEEGVAQSCSPIVISQSMQLGQGEALDLQMRTVQLRPGDRIFWYTDGLLEARLSDNRKISRRQLGSELETLSKKHLSNARTLCDDVLEMGLQFLGKEADERADDITVVVAAVPRSASFIANASVTSVEGKSTRAEHAS